MLVNHVTRHVSQLTNIDSPKLQAIKMNKAVTVYDGMRLMVAAWDAVPKYMVLKWWHKVGFRRH